MKWQIHLGFKISVQRFGLKIFVLSLPPLQVGSSGQAYLGFNSSPAEGHRVNSPISLFLCIPKATEAQVKQLPCCQTHPGRAPRGQDLVFYILFSLALGKVPGRQQTLHVHLLNQQYIQ